MLRHPLRVAIRLGIFVGITLAALSEAFWRIGWFKVTSFPARAAWLNRWSRRTLRSFNIQVHHTGHPPIQGFLVSNHLSYLDILVLAAIAPTVFVSKYEVRRWPAIGWLAQCAGTLFVQREQRSDVQRLGSECEKVIQSGTIVGLFPEGTSTDGSQVLPFYSALLAPAARHQWPVTPAWITYELAEGSVAEEICYWREMTFFPHFLNLLSKKRLQATVIYGEPLSSAMDRKELARALHERVCHLKETHAAKKRRPDGAPWLPATT